MLPLPPPHTYARPLGPACLDPLPLGLPLSALRIRLGFPSPAEDFQDDEIDLNQVLIRNPPATFLYRAEGWSMLLAGVCDGDILVVDRSVRPISGDMVLAVWDGNQPVCKILQVASDHIELHSRSPHCAPIILSAGTEVEIFAVVGVVRQVTRTHARAGR
ncbi:translesion error-prone DNA polymerase V autoproteolytic subunit [Xanthomonas arboricola]|nr:S24 family peptidase [Xanthomonas arboricola]QDS17493.1 translesion error-prone DNA polymerase V autoproteolytic subunit [Xanthomonas arboricola]